MLACLVAALLTATGFQTAKAGDGARIIVFGDSLSAGFNLAPDAGFVPQLERRLKADGMAVTVMNASVSGDTTAGGRSRLDWAIAGPPGLVILELGANDALRGIDPKITRDNLAAMIETLQQRGHKLLLAGMLAPPNMGREYETAFNAVYPSLARAYNVPLYPFFLDGVAARPELVQADGKHPTAEGVAVIVARIAPMIIGLIGATPTAGEK